MFTNSLLYKLSSADLKTKMMEMKEKESISIKDGEKWPLNYFDGDWNASGYTCNGNTPAIEKVNCVTLDNSKTKCTKTLGDDCVTTGNETFTATFGSSELTTGNKMNAVYILGGAWNPNSSKGNSQVWIVDANTFKSGYGLTYVRATPYVPPTVIAPAPAAPSVGIKEGDKWRLNYFDGDWDGFGYSCNFKTPKIETVNCKNIDNTKVTCTKTLGDDCVTTGNETFTAIFGSPLLTTGNKMNAVYILGNMFRPNSSKGNSQVWIVDENTFKSGYGLTYVRNPKYVAPAPVPAPVVVQPEPAPVVYVQPVPAPVVVQPEPAPVVVVQPSPAPSQPMVYYYTNYFLGNWNGIGYTCDAQTPAVEVVNIKYFNGRLYATKLLGDNCVPANKLSFEGALPSTLWQGLVLPVKFVIGSPELPAARQVDDNIKIIDINTFQIGNRTFFRVMGPGDAHPDGVYINMTPIIGKSQFAGPGYVKLNPKTNMRTPVRRFVVIEESTDQPGNC